MGVISNVDGSFRIPTFYRDKGDVLIISSMGYQKQELLVFDLALYKMNLIRLEPAVFELTEAVVSAKKKRELRSGSNIVRKAIRAIPQNYPQDTFSAVGYYRDYQRENEQYVNLNEAILEVFDPGFDQFDYPLSKVRLYEYKANIDFERDKISDRPYDYVRNTKTIAKAYLPSYGGNEFVLLRVHDAVRNYKINSYDFVNRLEVDFVNNHFFRKETDTYVDGEYLYTVKFTKRLLEYRIEGTMYISKRNFAIHKLSYSIRKNWVPTSTKKNKVYSDIIFEVVNEYKPKYGKLYLNYISFHNTFQLAKPPELIINEVVADRIRGCFELRFSLKIDPVYAAQEKNYRLKYLGDRIKFKRVAVFDDKVRLYPDMSAFEIEKMIALIDDATKSKEDLTALFDVQVKDLRGSDSAGRVVRLNESQAQEYHQFREFFVQEIKPNAIVPQDTLFMDKTKPIFEDQPVIKPDNFGDYWMNTPLKNVKE